MLRWLFLISLAFTACVHSKKSSNKFSTIVHTEYGASAYPMENRQTYLSLLKSAGANMASVLMTCQTPTMKTAEIDCDSENSPQVKNITSFLQEAKSQGFQTSLRVYVDLLDGQWRALWDPKDKEKTFANLKSTLIRFAKYSEANGVDLFILGAEYEKLTRPEYAKNWTEIIAAVRKFYKGPVTYGANGNYSSFKKPEYAWVPFWKDLDFVGVDHYAPYTGTDLTEKAFVEHHQSFLEKYRAVASGKPLFFNEVGFPEAKQGYKKPYEWKWKASEPVDWALQALNLKAFYKATQDKNVRGVAVWRFMPNEKKVYPGGYFLNHEQAKKALRKSHKVWGL